MGHIRPQGRSPRAGPPPIFAGVDRQGPRAQRPRPAGGGELAVHGERCRLFDDGSGAAAAFEAGDHLLPWFGREVDRFDARLLLSAAPSAGSACDGAAAAAVGQQEEAELDAERYRDLHAGSDEESDEEAAPVAGGAAVPFSYGSSGSSGGARSEPSFQQVGYSYADTAAPATGAPGDAGEAAKAADEQHGELFVAPFEVPESLQGSLPTTMRQHQVMAQTADFVREAGGQSEFRLGMQQAGNPNFGFLRPGDRCFPYYRWLLRAAPAAAQPTPQRTASLQGPTGLAMLSASYDTDQASDPPTPRASRLNPDAAAVEQVDGDAEEAAEGTSAEAHAATAAAEGGGGSEAAAAAPAAAARHPGQEAGGTMLPLEASSEAAKPASPRLPSLAAEPPSTPAAVQAIMEKLVDFVKAKGVAVGLALARREATNPRFGFLLPADAFHAAWRAAVEAALEPAAAALLLPPMSPAATPAAAEGAPATAAVQQASAQLQPAGADAAGSAAAAAESIQQLVEADTQAAAPDAAAGAAPGCGSSKEHLAAGGQAAAAAPNLQAVADGDAAAERPAAEKPSGGAASAPPADSSGAAAAAPAAAPRSKVMRAHYTSAAQPAGSSRVQPASVVSAAVPASLPATATAVAPATTAAAAEASTEPGASKLAAGKPAAAKPVSSIRANPQLAQRIIGPHRPPQAAAGQKPPPRAADAGLETFDDFSSEPAAGAGATDDGDCSGAGGQAERRPKQPPWLAAVAGDLDGGSGSDSPVPGSPAPDSAAAGGDSPRPEAAEAAGAVAEARIKKARRLKAVREALAAKQRAAAERDAEAARAAAKAAAAAATEAEAERRQRAAAAAAEARRRRRIFLGEEAAEEPDASERPPLLKPRLTSEELWARLQPTGSSGHGSAAGRAGSDGLSRQQLGMSVGHIMAQLRAADTALAASGMAVAGVASAAGSVAGAADTAADGAGSDERIPVGEAAAASGGAGSEGSGSGGGGDGDRRKSTKRHSSKRRHGDVAGGSSVRERGRHKTPDGKRRREADSRGGSKKHKH